MKSVIERLDDIENTARSIVAKAEEDKSQVEQEIQAQRDQFDKELDEKTQAELTRIREDGKRQVDELLKSQREKNHVQFRHWKRNMRRLMQFMQKVFCVI